MKKKNEFETLVNDIDEKFKTIKVKSEKLKAIQKKHVQPKKEEPSRYESKMKERNELHQYRMKEKLTAAAVVFVLGQLLLIPVYMKHPALIPQIFIAASISLGVICLAVLDYY